MSCKLISITAPVNAECETAEDLIAYIARVSNPANQANKTTSSKLLKYLIRNHHWSPFEQVSLTIEIETTRDIGRQILRHRSFVFQEFSQRYAEATEFHPGREARLQDTKNRQNSIETDDTSKAEWWQTWQDYIKNESGKIYKIALHEGIAKEQARAVLPEGLTMSRMYMTGNLRNWIHYCQLRMGNGTQKEHAEIAKACWAIICEQFPSLEELFPPADEFDDLIDAFALALKAKLRQKKDEGREGWDTVYNASLWEGLKEAVGKDDPIDIANFAAFIWWRQNNDK